MSASADSKFQKRVNRLTKRIIEQQQHLEVAKLFRQQASDLIKKLLAEDRITKSELSNYFKKRPKNA